MILGYLLFAIVAAALSFVFALLSGVSVLLALGVYTLVGTLTLIIVPMIILFGASLYQDGVVPITKRQSRNGNTELGVHSVDRM